MIEHVAVAAHEHVVPVADVELAVERPAGFVDELLRCRDEHDSGVGDELGDVRSEHPRTQLVVLRHEHRQLAVPGRHRAVPVPDHAEVVLVARDRRELASPPVAQRSEQRVERRGVETRRRVVDHHDLEVGILLRDERARPDARGSAGSGR